MLPITTQLAYEYYKQCNHIVSTDTRKVEKGSLFICLKGPNFNGNTFAQQALTLGAGIVLSDMEEFCTDPRIILVEDCLIALQNLASFHRNKLSTKIIAIAGSNGKTTTKELCLSVLGTERKVIATPGNLNNHIGVPLTLLSINNDHDFGIVELGTNHPGEMAVLCNITNANMGIVTNIGKEHLEGFGSIENVAKEESELYLNLSKVGNLALVNNDDDWLQVMSKRLTNIFTYGTIGDCDLKGEVIASMPFLIFRLQYKGVIYGPYTAELGGSYNLHNIMASIATGISVGIDIEKCAKAACSYSPSNNRSEWRTLGNKNIWLDAYNANPSSVEAALRDFAKISGKKCAFLGDMLELGSFAAEEHKFISNLTKELGIETWFSGFEFQMANPGNPKAFADTDSLCNAIKIAAPSFDYCLIKGSRGMKMEKILDAISE